MFNGLARSFSFKKGRSSENRHGGREAAEAMAKDAKKNDLILRTSGTVNASGSDNFASVFSKRGQKGMNQDCCIVWEVYNIMFVFSLHFIFLPKNEIGSLVKIVSYVELFPSICSMFNNKL